jgi:hypothetical protein
MTSVETTAMNQISRTERNANNEDADRQSSQSGRASRRHPMAMAAPKNEQHSDVAESYGGQTQSAEEHNHRAIEFSSYGADKPWVVLNSAPSAGRPSLASASRSYTSALPGGYDGIRLPGKRSPP